MEQAYESPNDRGFFIIVPDYLELISGPSIKGRSVKAALIKPDS